MCRNAKIGDQYLVTVKDLELCGRFGQETKYLSLCQADCRINDATKIVGPDRKTIEFIIVQSQITTKARDKKLLDFYHFNQFKIQRVINTGTFGFCYEAISKDNQQVVIKIIKPKPEAFVAFKNENRKVLNTLSHKNIVIKFLDLGEKESINLYVIMEYIHGYSLHHILHNQKNHLEISIKLKYINDIMLGIEYLHKNLIYHMDLKPNNIMVNETSNSCKIIDFGSCIIKGKPKYLIAHDQVNSLQDFVI
ncbi:hypothetical protein RF11_10029 [Thelohanellus kitauei]|uniref:Protein kinase domain-containing protein n=1 Tax=Thelohanellus kitauei TaxID=669202 RepID=A0A0C2N3Q4_THEKT|nr:hypothetical protein RF11_10029 [Thelohanellus kitauei]